MPDPKPVAPCVFLGTAASVRVRGVGAADLTPRAAYSEGADAVGLRGARIGAEMVLVVDHPAELVPVDVNADGAPYDATYKSGTPAVVRIESGGAPGHVRGELASAPACAREACPVVWVGKANSVALHAKGGAPLDLSGAFPLGDAAAERHVDEVALDGAVGTLRCDGVDTPIQDEQLGFTAGAGGLRLAPLRLEGGVIHVQVSGDSGVLHFGRVAAGAALVTVLLVAGLLALALRSTRPADPPAGAASP
jgi:hypothetical protein